MATITYTITGNSLCSPNEGHITLHVANGITGTRRFDVKDLKGGVSDQEVADALLILLRRHCEPFTLNQIKNALGSANVTITSVNS